MNNDITDKIKSDLSTCIQNTQRICITDVEKLCTKGFKASKQTSAYTDWTSQNYKRHTYKNFHDVPFGFGGTSDECLHREFEQYEESNTRTRMIPKCVEWIEKTEAQFQKLYEREKGNDKREIFVIVSTLFATTVSGVVGYMLGLFIKDRDDIFSYNNRAENKKILMYFGIAISLPFFVILWASPRLLLLMAVAFGIGRGVQYYIEKKQDGEYSGLPGSDSGLVFAAIPVSID